MERRYGRGFNAVAKKELWDRWRRGESLKAIGRASGKPSSSIYFQVSPHGGIRPPPAVYHPCFATRLGGVSAGSEIQGWRDSSHTAMVGAGKFGSAKVPMATATYPGKPSLSQ